MNDRIEEARLGKLAAAARMAKHSMVLDVPASIEEISALALEVQQARAASAVLCDQGLRKAAQPPIFLKGEKVRVDNDRYHGEGIVQWDTGVYRRMVGVRLESGNVWGYEVETVKLANQPAALTRQDGPVIGGEPTHLTRGHKTLCGLTKWESGNVDIEFGIANTTTCMKCLRCIALEWMPAPRREPESTQEPPSQQEAEAGRLRGLCAAVYQFVGANMQKIGGCRRFLDALSNAANGEPFDTEHLLPYDSDEPICMTDVQPAPVQPSTDDVVERMIDAFDPFNDLLLRKPNRRKYMTAALAVARKGWVEIDKALAEPTAEEFVEAWPHNHTNGLTCVKAVIDLRRVRLEAEPAERVTDPAERVNLVTGDRVRLVGQKPGETFTIESSSIYEQRTFYRLKEINGGLFLRESLTLGAK